MSNQSEGDGISLQGFRSSLHGSEFEAYISALESFNQIPQLQELKKLGHERAGIRPGAHVLEVGCGFGLETLRLARMAAPCGRAAGCDLSADFLAEAQRRAQAAGLDIEFTQARAEALPYPEHSFGVLWAERVLIYVPDVRKAVSEMRRVLHPGGRAALIEPDISTSTINLEDRALVRRVMGHEADTSVAHGWLPGLLRELLKEVGFGEIELATRVAVFAPELAASYFAQCGRTAATAGAISDVELHAWNAGIEELVAQKSLFATVGYFLFTASA